MTDAQPKIIQYTNLLHQWRDPQAPEVLKFLAENKDDPLLLRRAAVLNKLYGLKDPKASASIATTSEQVS